MTNPARIVVQGPRSSFEVNTDDYDLASLLSSSHAGKDPRGTNADAKKLDETAANLRQRSKAQSGPSSAKNSTPLSGEQLIDLLQDSPFIDTQSAMTAYEWFKFVTLIPWLLFRIVVAIPLLILVWGSVSLLVAGIPVNTPLPAWRQNVLHVYLK